MTHEYELIKPIGTVQSIKQVSVIFFQILKIILMM